MEKPILQLEFHLRKPYNESKLLIEAFNGIIEEGGRAEICIKNDNPSKNRNILMLKIYRCRNSYYSTSLSASINCPTSFEIEDPKDSIHGQTIKMSVFQTNNLELNKVLKSNFETFDLA